MVERIHVAMGLEQEQHQVADSIAPRDISATGWRQNYGVLKRELHLSICLQSWSYTTPRNLDVTKFKHNYGGI